MDYNQKLITLSRKYRQFFEDTTPGQILVTICPYTYELDYAAFGVPTRAFSSWNFDTDAKAFAEYNKKLNDIWVGHTKDLDNDYFPALSVNVGYGAHSAYFSGTEVIMGEETSWTDHFIKDWSDMDKLKMDENNYWYKKVLEITQYHIDLQDGDYAVAGFSNAGPGDMANALRGNDIFYDIYDEPEMVHALMEKCVDALVWMERSIEKLTGDVNGGSIAANCWFPGRNPYISGDFNDLCSAEVFREFDFKYMQKVIDHFEGAFIHHHAKGLHVHRDFAKLKNLKLLEISWDPNMPRPIDSLPEIYEMNNGVPLMVRCHARDVYKYIDQLKASRTVLMLNIDNLEEGKEVMKLIRKNSII